MLALIPMFSLFAAATLVAGCAGVRLAARDIADGCGYSFDPQVGLRLSGWGHAEPVRFWVVADSHLNLRDERDTQYAEGSMWISGVYIAGNHDWHFRGEAGTPEELRRKWTTTRMSPLYQGADPQCASRVVKGVRFVMIDNSLHNVTDEQTAFFRAEAAKGDPVCLVMHIPFWHEGWSTDTCACPIWEKRERKWEEFLFGVARADRQDESTFAFRRAVELTPNLIGVFAGHTHRWQFAQDPSVFHITATGAMFGDCLKVEVS